MRAISALTLLVLGVALADDASHAVALDDLAVLADRLHAAADFHSALQSWRGFFGQDSELSGFTTRTQARQPRRCALAQLRRNRLQGRSWVGCLGDRAAQHHVGRAGFGRL